MHNFVPAKLIEDPFEGPVPGRTSRRQWCIRANVKLPDAGVLGVIAARLAEMDADGEAIGKVLVSRAGEIVLAYTIDKNVGERICKLHAGDSCFVHPVMDATTLFVLPGPGDW
jgi:hypothetical protein